MITRRFVILTVITLTALVAGLTSYSHATGAVCGGVTGDLFTLPGCALLPDGTPDSTVLLSSISCSTASLGTPLPPPSVPGQSVSVQLSEYMWCDVVIKPTRATEKGVIMFLESWTPTWPPTEYYGVYHTSPSPLTVTVTLVTTTGTVTLTDSNFEEKYKLFPSLPRAIGTYYMWLVFDPNRHYYEEAIGDFRVPLLPPAHIKISISASRTSSTKVISTALSPTSAVAATSTPQPTSAYTANVTSFVNINTLGAVSVVAALAIVTYLLFGKRVRRGNTKVVSEPHQRTKSCAGCGMKLPMDALFCDECGSKQR